MVSPAHPKLLTFEQAIAGAEPGKRMHVLLGNGFSRAYRNDIFAYDALFKRADFTKLPNAQNAFAALGTTDFEVVMSALRRAALLVAVYRPSLPDLAKLFEEEANALREVLANAIEILKPFQYRIHAQLRPASLLGHHAKRCWTGVGYRG
jgi:hypothetical protein